MAEAGSKSFSSELPDSSASAQATGYNSEPSTAETQFQPDQRNMEFASLPTHQFGHLGMAQSPFDMRHMSGMLPDYPQRYHQSQHQNHIAQSAGVDPTYAYLSFPSQQFASQVANQYQTQYPQALAPQYRGASGYGTSTAGNPAELLGSRTATYSQHRSNYNTNMSQQSHYLNFPGQQASPYGNPNGPPYQGRTGMTYQVPHLQVDSTQMGAGPRNYAHSPEVLRRNSSDSSLQTSSALRGPPRKPKQSGHALWVGNLPPGTQITDLKDHFSRDATEDIESVFLISKSNCAFVNYKTVETCAAAMTRFHDSRFRGVRLVCRLRRGSNAAASPASTAAQPEMSKSTLSAEMMNEMRSPTQMVMVVPQDDNSVTPRSSPGKIAKEKFFIVKSLTVEDLERSVVSGIWATQAHNEDNLNAAFESAENVYLIFSANKSGEYFGYARMESQISVEAAPAAEPEKADLSQQVPHPAGAANVPVTIPTPATSTAPRGHIVDDSARGTIFWEAEHDNVAVGGTSEDTAADAGEGSGDESTAKGSGAQSMTFGKPFRISWQSSERLPFYRTRGLRNPWNANREVKIARDGTELEPSVGRKLIGMFEQQAQVSAAARSGGPPPQYGGYTQQMPQYLGGGMMPQMPQMPQMPYGYGPQGPGQGYGRPY